MRRGIEERPRHEEAEDENKTAVGSGLGHDLVPSLQLNELFLFFGPICDARQLPVLIYLKKTGRYFSVASAVGRRVFQAS
jgi:hypothetical protein